MKDTLTLLGGFIAVAYPIFFAWRIGIGKVPPQNPASWFMWTVLDVIAAITTALAGKPYWLPLGCAVGAGAVTVVLHIRGQWLWSGKEIFCAIAVAITTYFWIAYGPVQGLTAGVLSLNIAGIPNYVDRVRKPIRETFPMWASVTLACALTLLGSDWSFAGTIMAWGGLAYNGSLSLIVLRDNVRKGP